MSVFTHYLKNGFRIAVEEIPEYKTATIGIWVNVGSRSEERAENGISHFLEHMVFKGTLTRNALEIAQRIENVGGYINAYTGREVTNYSSQVLSEHLGIAFDVLSDIILNSKFTDNDIELERDIILQEIGMYLDSPDDVVFDSLQNICYPNQALGRSILGTVESVKKFEQGDFFNFLKRFYGPQQMILCVAGGIDHSHVFRLAEEKFDFLESNIVPTPSVAKFVGGESNIKKELEQVHFALALEAPKLTDPNLYDARIFASILGGGMSSRLFQEVREKRALCYSIFSFMETLSDTGSIMVYSSTSNDKINELSEVVVNEMKSLVFDIKDDELERAKAQMKAGFMMTLESSTSRCERMARSLAVWGRILELDEVVDRIESVELRKVKDFGLGLLNSKKAALSVYGPLKESLLLSKVFPTLSS